ncbi:hypothetical protein [Streptomyces olivaceiscleroticus]|uniref:Uncharacterized protein n=1 Tax=Streptomyces olivaceiscleroticus TaxID=68245 RepID=A0ABP3K0A6_9ACTN
MREPESSSSVGSDFMSEAILSQLAELNSRVSELSEKVNDVLAHLVYSRDDLTGAEDEVHRALADEIGLFVGQKILSLAYMGVPRSKDGGYAKKRVAQLISKLCSCYLAPSGVDVNRARRILRARKGDECWQAAGQAALHAKRIFDSARSRGIEFIWDYDVCPGMPIDESRQQAWSNCDPEADVSFVVIPGYVANGECYRPQTVFTDEARG